MASYEFNSRSPLLIHNSSENEGEGSVDLSAPNPLRHDRPSFVTSMNPETFSESLLSVSSNDLDNGDDTQSVDPRILSRPPLQATAFSTQRYVILVVKFQVIVVVVVVVRTHMAHQYDQSSRTTDLVTSECNSLNAESRSLCPLAKKAQSLSRRAV